jgi:PAS domain S-box-containing protein
MRIDSSENTANLDALPLLKVVHHAEKIFIRGEHSHQEVFKVLLDGLLAVTGSEYGFIGRIIEKENEEPYLKVLAMTNIAWNKETQALYNKHKADGMEFHHLKSIYGHVITSNKPYISNTPATDPHKYGIPTGHPSLNAFLGIPILSAGAMIGMVGIANRAGGYSEEVITFLEPLTDTCAVLIDAITQRQSHEHDIARLELTKNELYRNEQILRSLSDSHTHYVTRTDLQGRYTYVNQGFIKHFGHLGKVVGEDSLSTMHPEDIPASIATVEACLRNPGSIHTIRIRKPLFNGSYILTEWEFIALSDADGVPYEMQCVGRDISNEAAFEQSLEIPKNELAEFNTYLESRVAARTKELSDLNREKDEFMGIAAHDLKNPLSAIKLSAERILMHHERGTHSFIPSIANTINLASERMLSIIQNLLELNRIESGNFPLTMTALPSTKIEQFIGEYHERASEKGITLVSSVQESLRIKADENAMQHIVENLLSNAIKYSPEWKTVTVRLTKEISAQGTKVARFQVKDEGAGLTEEDQKRLFVKFARLSTRPTAGEHSTGLGLSIVKTLVELQHGRVWCESIHGMGATFIVELPLWEEEK